VHLKNIESPTKALKRVFLRSRRMISTMSNFSFTKESLYIRSMMNLRILVGLKANYVCWLILRSIGTVHLVINLWKMIKNPIETFCNNWMNCNQNPAEYRVLRETKCLILSKNPSQSLLKMVKFLKLLEAIKRQWSKIFENWK
jgi:hypothetical protein